MRSRMVSASFTVALLVILSYDQLVYRPVEGNGNSQVGGRNEVLAPFRDLKDVVIGLLDVCDDPTDTDNDTLPDKVERVIGTDPKNPDSDFDKLNDTFEANNGMDPLKPDSNFDGVPDLFEVRDVVLDIDGDSIGNVWDDDNDGDGVGDKMDLSPFHSTAPNGSFHFSVRTTGEPLYLDIQLRPKNPDHLRLLGQVYDWPHDELGSMRDLDDSKNDVTSTPYLEIRTNAQLDPDEVAEYGISVLDDRSILAITPVSENGMTVAFQGKIFIPASDEPVDLEIDLRLKWKIMANNDAKGMVLKWNDGGSVAVDEDGNVTSSALEGSVLLLSELGQDRIALKDLYGRFLTLSDDGILGCGDSGMVADSIFEKKMRSGGMFTLESEQGLFLTKSESGMIRAISTEDASSLLWDFEYKGIYNLPMMLAVYDEEMLLTGFSVEENLGCGVGMVYGDDPDMMLAANMVLFYQFLRNNTNSMEDMPDVLSGQMIDCSAELDRFEHRDEAMRYALTQMKDAAYGSLPEGVMLPLTLIIDDHFRSVSPTDILGASSGLGSGFLIDMDVSPIIWSRTMKSSYYERPAQQSLSVEEVLSRYYDMDIPEEAKETILFYTIPWMAGDQVVISIGTDLKEFAYPELDIASQSLINIIEYGITAFTTLHESVLLINSALHLSKLAKLAGVSVFSKGSLSLLTSIHESLSSTSHAKFGNWNKFGKCLLVLEVVIAVGMSIFALITIGNSFDWSATGTFIAVVYSVMMLAYSIALIVIGCLGPAGFVIAMIIALSDMIVGWICGSGWFQMFLEWFIGLFTDFNERTKVDLRMGESSVDIDDKDKNGLSAGDRITYSANSTGIVNRTSDGTYGDLVESYVKPVFRVAVPAQSRSIGQEFITNLGEIITGDSKTTSYNSGFWIEPGAGMVNYPMAFWLDTQYNVYYEECWWFLWWHCDRKSNMGSQAGSVTTLYFDVMPKDMDELGNWRGMTPLDADGDGINNTDELDTHPWKWDTDGDALCDKLELETGSDPTKADTDVDGIDDGTEFHWFMDRMDPDSDDDGMSDYQEHKGWVVTFDFCGETFNWTINSDPRLNDTDGDGLSDRMEYLCKLNPRSADTDGDGVKDRLKDYFETTFEYKVEVAIDYYPYDVLVLPNGSSVVLTLEGDYPLQILDPSGNFLGTLRVDERYIQDPDQVLFGPNGSIIITEMTWGPYIAYVHVFDPDLKHNRSYQYANIIGFMSAVFDGEAMLHCVVMDGGEAINYALIDVTDGTLVEMTRLTAIESISEYGEQIFDIALDQDGNRYFASSYFIFVLNDHDELIRSFGSPGTGEGQFNSITCLIFDRNGDLLVLDSGLNRIQKMDEFGRFIAKIGESGTGPCQFKSPLSIDEFGDGLLFVSDTYNHRIQIIYNNVTLYEVEETTGFEDTDGDGLEDIVEINGHYITVDPLTRAIINATSDPKVADTDGDGLSDLIEWNVSSDPRSIDTDNDGLPDPFEFALDSNLSAWDTDGDGLGDGIEDTFLSSSLLPDSDLEGLDDRSEFDLGTDPNDPDSDDDGLTDLQEHDFGSDPLDPDEDGDFKFDSSEADAGTSPDDPDDDRDGLKDGYEDLYGTDPLSGDSDADDLPDGYEVDANLDPMSNDTDSDGMLDGFEVEVGLNPLSSDSDGDGIKDSIDLDFAIELEESIVMLYDPSDPVGGYIENLSSSVDTVVGDPTDPSTFTGWRYIVIVGEPGDGEGTPGGIMTDILSGTGILDSMTDSDLNRFAARYGVWTENQTVIMLSTPYDGDHIRTLGMLKSMRMMVKNGFVRAEVLNPRICYSIDNFEIVKETGTSIRARFTDNTTFNVTVERGELGPFNREEWTGLEEMEVPMSKAIRFEIDSIHPVLAAEIDILYNASDLDRSGDGTVGPGDIDETSIGLFFLNETTGHWERATEVLDWVLSTRVNATDLDTFGIPFSGRVQAMVGHLSTYVLTGRLLPDDKILPVVADPGGDRTVYVDEYVQLDGTNSTGNGRIFNFTWTVSGLPWTGHGPTTRLSFNRTGYYKVTLTVLDQLGLRGASTITVNVIERPPTHFILIVGPLMGEDGRPVPGATIMVLDGDLSAMNTTGEEGIARIRLPAILLNRTVTVRVQKEGYLPLELTMRITPEGKLEANLPVLKRKGIEVDEPNNHLYICCAAAVILSFLLVLLLVMFLVLLRKKSGGNPPEE